MSDFLIITFALRNSVRAMMKVIYDDSQYIENGDAKQRYLSSNGVIDGNSCVIKLTASRESRFDKNM
ncbi:hypothetical protein SOASR031_03920 [Leminorella grimontii]|nr:hypothetical protein SOASR031_03920 [Leminorella grimontii]